MQAGMDQHITGSELRQDLLAGQVAPETHLIGNCQPLRQALQMAAFHTITNDPILTGRQPLLQPRKGQQAQMKTLPVQQASDTDKAKWQILAERHSMELTTFLCRETCL